MRRIAPLLVGIVVCVMPTYAHAAAWGVDKTTDTPVGQACPTFTHCSLREAVTSTELNPGPDAILVGGGTYPLTNGELDVTQNLIVSRVGAFGATISGSDASRIFDISGSGTDFVFRFLTAAHGKATGDGGAIRAGAGTTLGIESSNVQNSLATDASQARGGAIYSDGAVAVGVASGSTTGSTISGNTAEMTGASGAAKGGGVAVGTGGTLVVGARTTISGNHANATDETSASALATGGGVFADDGATLGATTVSGNDARGGRGQGGGIAAPGGTTTVSRSTVSGNTTEGSADGQTTGGAGIALYPASTADLQADRSTIANNSAAAGGTGSVAAGGAIYQAGGGESELDNSTVAGNGVIPGSGATAVGGGLAGAGSASFTLGGSIMAENTQTGTSQCDQATIASAGDNVLGPISDCTYLSDPSDATNVADAGLKPLGVNGGLTQTMLLENSSPALDRIDGSADLCTNFSTDQRGITRPQNGSCDTGSVEMRPATLIVAPTTRDFGYANLSTPATSTVSVSNTGDLDLPAPTANVAAPFSATGCTSDVPGGSSCILDLQFTPTAGGSFTRTLQVTSGSLSDDATLHGIGWAPTAPPQIKGTPSVGYKTGVATGRWPGPVASFTAQWRRCDASGNNCSDIAGATRTVYTPHLADEGNTLRVVLTAKSTTGVDSDPVTTAASAVVTRTTPTVLQAPKVERSSAPTVGTTLHAYRGQWTGAPDSYAFQWIRCDNDGTSNCADIAGATHNRYTPSAGDVDHTLRVRVTATNPAGTSAPATSAPSGVVTT